MHERTMMRRFRDLLCTALVLPATMMAQAPAWKSALPDVRKDGLHAIVLAPELMGVSRDDLGDLRLLDSAGREVPYVIRTAEAGTHAHFEPYALLRNEVLPKNTIIEVERPSDQAMEQLLIRVRPAEVGKQLRVTASDDRKQWYMVRDDAMFLQGAIGDPPYQVLSVPLPRSDYRYYRVELNDSLTPPMRVLDVGRMVGERASVRRTDAAALAWTQQDTANTTILHVRSPHPLVLDRIAFTVKDTGLFHRAGRIQAWRWATNGNGRRKRVQREAMGVASFTIGSDKAWVIDPGMQRLDTFDLVIDNGNDRPLRFSDLRASVTERLLLAELKPGERYTLTSGAPERSAPRYDLAHFATDLPAPVDTLSAGGLEAMPRDAAKGPGFDPARWWIWAVILALMAGMGVLAFRMMRQEGATPK
jgi:hypothetical protein